MTLGALTAALSVAATVLAIGVLALIARKRLGAAGGGGDHTVHVVSAASFIVAAPAVARRFVEADAASASASAFSEESTWAVVAVPAAAAGVCAAVRLLRAGRPPGPPEPLLLCSALGAPIVLILCSLAGRLVMIDALLIFVSVSAWMWLVAERRPVGRSAASGASSIPVLVVSALVAGALAFVALDPILGPAAGALTGLALVALLLPLIRPIPGAGGSGGEEWSGVLIHLSASVAPLAAIAGAAVAHVLLLIARAGDESSASASTWIVGAAEAAASTPYLPGLSRAVTPALFLLALPLLDVALRATSPAVVRFAGGAVFLGAVVLGVGAVVST